MNTSGAHNLNKSYFPRGNTQEDVEEAVKTTKLTLKLAMEILRPFEDGQHSNMEIAKAAGALAQIIHMDLWDRRRERLENQTN